MGLIAPWISADKVPSQASLASHNRLSQWCGTIVHKALWRHLPERLQYVQGMEMFLRAVFISAWGRIESFKAAFRSLLKASTCNCGSTSRAAGTELLSSPSAPLTPVHSSLFCTDVFRKTRAFSWSFLQKNGHFGNKRIQPMETPLFPALYFLSVSSDLRLAPPPPICGSSRLPISQARLLGTRGSTDLRLAPPPPPPGCGSSRLPIGMRRCRVCRGAPTSDWLLLLLLSAAPPASPSARRRCRVRGERGRGHRACLGPVVPQLRTASAEPFLLFPLRGGHSWQQTCGGPQLRSPTRGRAFSPVSCTCRRRLCAGAPGLWGFSGPPLRP